MKMPASPDSICEKYVDLGVKITLKKLDDDCVLVEGSALDLEFLGELLLAQARYQKVVDSRSPLLALGKSFSPRVQLWESTFVEPANVRTEYLRTLTSEGHQAENKETHTYQT